MQDQLHNMSTESSAASGDVKKPRFAPKEEVHLDPPRSEFVSKSYLAHCTGKEEDYPTLVAIKGQIFDVSKNPVYAPGKGYNVFTGRDASCALGKTSLEDADCHDDISELTETERQTLDDWFTFFQYRYNIVGRVEGSHYFKEES